MTDHIDTAQERAKLEGLAEHTPGPWDAHGLTVYDTCMDGVASCHTNADARLIAAAPDLLATVHRLLDALDAERARAEKAEAERDQALARLAAAYKAADICALTPADAEAALQRVVDAAHTAGVEACAEWIDRHRENYQCEHGTYDPSTGVEEYPGTGEEWVQEQMETAEAIRALKRPEASHE